MKKVFLKAAVLFAAVLSVVSCVDTMDKEEISIELDTSNLVFENAVSGLSSKEVSVVMKNCNASFTFHSTDDSIVSVKSATSTSATVVARGDGNAKILASSEDGKHNLYCNVHVSLGEVYCHEIKTLEVKGNGSDYVELSWSVSEDVPQVQVLVFKGEGSDPDQTVYFDAADGSGKVENLDQGTDYTFKAYGCCNGGTAKETVNEVVKNVSAQTLPSVVAPSSVAMLPPRITDHSATLMWNDPSDRNFTQVIVSTSQKNMFGEPIEPVVVEKDMRKVTFENLSSGTEYAFVLKSKDKFGNLQGDSNNASNPGLVNKITTDDDNTAPSDVKDIYIQARGASLSLTWNCDDAMESADFDKVEISIGGTPVYAARGEVKKDVTISGTEEVSIKTVDLDGNRSAGFTLSVSSDSSGSLSYENFNAESQWTSQARATWTSRGQGSIILYAENTNDPNDIIYSDVYDSSAGSGAINGLSIGETYKVYACDSQVNEKYKIVFIDEEGAKTVVSREVIWSIKQPWGSRILTPFITDSASNVNCVIAQDDDSHIGKHKYPYWIVRPALNGSIDSFSLEACGRDLIGSGLYLNIDPSVGGSFDTDLDKTGWGHSKSDKGLYTRTAVEEKIEDKGSASFYMESSDYDGDTLAGYSDWKYIYVKGSGFQLWSANSNVIGDTKSYVNGKTQLDKTFAYKEIVRE